MIARPAVGPAMQAKVRVPVAAASDVAWARLTELSKLPEWMPDVVACTSDRLHVGARRVAVLHKPRYGKDRLVEAIDWVGDHAFSYDIEGGTGPMRRVHTTWRIREDEAEGGCAVEVESVFKMRGLWTLMAPLAALAWRRQLRVLAKGFASWAAHVDSGHPKGTMRPA